jgi:hypothetical protein
MIKKNTKAIFRSKDGEVEEELVGGIPLCVGEIMTIINPEQGKIDWKVVDKKVEYIDKGEDQFVEVVYVFERS